MNTSNVIKALTLAGKVAAVGAGLAGSLEPKTAAIVFVASSILKDVVNNLLAFFNKQ